MSLKKQQGFSMLEVLISMLIIMIGVLGMAGLQMLSINNTENARYQSIAATFASSMAAMMQGNYQFWATPQNITVSGPVSAPVITGFSPATSYLDCKANVCSNRKMAYYDLINWGAAIAGALPAGTATIACGSAVPTTCTLTLTWNEKNVALTNDTGTGTLAGGTIGTHSYQTLVSIVL